MIQPFHLLLCKAEEGNGYGKCDKKCGLRGSKMAKLYFRYGAMGSSKSANVLMVRYNYEERGQYAVLLKPRTDQRDGANVIQSRMGLSAPAEYVDEFLTEIGKTWSRDSEEYCYHGQKVNAVLVDEAHLLEPGARELLAGISTRRPVIFSGDCEDVISPDELGESAEMVWKSVPGVQTFRMTNRIRTNAELSVFIQNMMRLTRGKGRRMYPHVSAGYGNDEEEAEKLLKGYLALGYRYFEENAGSSEDVERLVVLLDDRYFYDETGYLRSGNRSVRRLFHRLNQAKEELAFVVKKNEAVYSVILGLLQAM